MSNINCGCLQLLKKNSIVSSELELRTNEIHTIGTDPLNDIRLKVQTAVPEYSIIKAKHNGLVKFSSNSVTNCEINGKTFKGAKYLQPGDVISVLGKKFRYENVFLRKGDMKMMEKRNTHLYNEKLLKTKILNKGRTAMMKKNVIRTSVSLKGSMTPTPKYGRNMCITQFVEEDIENQPVTPSRNNTISVCTPRMRRVFNTPQSTGRNKKGKAFSFLQYQQINLKFGDSPNSSSRSIGTHEENNGNVSDGSDEEQAPAHSPINSFTLSFADSPDNTLLDDITNPGLVCNDDMMRTSSEHPELNILGEISPNNLSSRERNRNSGRKSLARNDAIFNMNSTGMIEGTPLNIHLSRGSLSTTTPSEKKSHFGRLTNRSTPKSGAKIPDANVSRASFVTKTPRRSILKRKDDTPMSSNGTSHPSRKATVRDDFIGGSPLRRNTVTSKNSNSFIEPSRMESEIGKVLVKQETKSLTTLNDSYDGESRSFAAFSLPIFTRNEFVTLRKSSRITNATKSQTDLLDDNDAISTGSSVYDDSDRDDGALNLNDTTPGVDICKSPSEYSEFASSSEDLSNTQQLSNHESFLFEDLVKPKIKSDEKLSRSNCGVKRTEDSVGNYEKIEQNRAPGVMRASEGDVRSTRKLRNTPKTGSSFSDDLTAVSDVENVMEKTPNFEKSPTKNSRKSRRMSGATPIIEDYPRNYPRAVRSSSTLLRTPTAKESYRNNLENGGCTENVLRTSKMIQRSESEDSVGNYEGEEIPTAPGIARATEGDVRSARKLRNTPKIAISFSDDLTYTSDVENITKKTPKFEKSPTKDSRKSGKISGVTPKIKDSFGNYSRAARISSKLHKTSDAEESSGNNLEGPGCSENVRRTSKMMQGSPSGEAEDNSTTPGIIRATEGDVRSAQKLRNTPKIAISFSDDLTYTSDVDNIMEKTPKFGESPTNDSRKSGRISVATLKIKESSRKYSRAAPSEDSVGDVQNTMVETPKFGKSHMKDSRKSAIFSLTTSKIEESSEKDISNVGGVTDNKKQKRQKSLNSDLSNVGAKKMFSTQKAQRSANDLTDVRGVKRLLKTPTQHKSPFNDLSDVRGVKKMLATPKPQKQPENDLSDLRGVKKLLDSQRKQQKQPANDLSTIVGVKKMFSTPKLQRSPANDLTDVRGVKRLLKTPKQHKSPFNDLSDVRGVKKMLATPKPQKQPENDLSDLRGVKKLLGSQRKQQKQPANDLSNIVGVKKMFSTPKLQRFPANDLTDVTGVKGLLKTPKQHKSPFNDLSDVRGIKKMLATPKARKQPKNDLSNLVGVKEMFSTPKPQRPPKTDLGDVGSVKIVLKTRRQQRLQHHDLIDVTGVKRMKATPKVQKPPKNDLTDVSGIKELFNDREQHEIVLPSKLQKSHRKDLTDITGIKSEMVLLCNEENSNAAGVDMQRSTPKHRTDTVKEALESSPPLHQDEMNDDRDPFDVLINRKIIRTYKKSVSPKINNIQKNVSTEKQEVPSVVAEWVTDQNKWLDDEEHDKMSTILAKRSDDAMIATEKSTTNIQKRSLRQTRTIKGDTLTQIETTNLSISGEITAESNRHSTPDIQKGRPVRQTRRNKGKTLDQVGLVELNEEIKTEPIDQSASTVQKRPTRQTRRNRVETLRSDLVKTPEISDSVFEKSEVEINNHTPDMQKRSLRQRRKDKGGTKETPEISKEYKTEPNNTPNIQKRPQRQTRRNKAETSSLNHQTENKRQTRRNAKDENISVVNTKSNEKCIEETTTSTVSTGSRRGAMKNKETYTHPEENKHLLANRQDGAARATKTGKNKLSNVDDSETTVDENKPVRTTRRKRYLYDADAAYDNDSAPLTPQITEKAQSKSEESKKVPMKRSRRNVNLPKILEEFELNIKRKSVNMNEDDKRRDSGKRKLEKVITPPPIDDEPQIRRSKRTRK